MIYTGNYQNCKTNTIKTFSISKDKGKDAGYNGQCFSLLAPKEDFFRKWRNNKGKISDEENNHFYIYSYYTEVLKDLDPEEIYKKLNNSILLCYEKNDEFCHRHIVSAWLEYYLNIKSYEVKINGEKIIILNRPENIKKSLFEIIENTTQKEQPLVRKKEIN